jgi:hypothetical protein
MTDTNEQSAEQMAAMFADNSFEATRIPARAANFIRGFCLWGLSLPVREAKTLVLIMIRVMVAYKVQGRMLQLTEEEIDDAKQQTH